MPNYNDNEKPYINYTSRDFNKIKNDLINYTKTYFPSTYSDFNESSPGMMLMEMSAYVGDVLNFYIDSQFKEMFVSTAEERNNVLNIAKTLGYKVKPIVPAMVEMTFKHTVDSHGTGPNQIPSMSQALLLNKGTSVKSDVNNVTFETLDICDFSVTSSYVPEPFSWNENGVVSKWMVKQNVIAVSGMTKTYDFSITSPNQFLKLTLPDKDVVSIISVKDSNENVWYEVDYLAQDKIFNDVHYYNDGDRSSSYDEYISGVSYSMPVSVPYKLNAAQSVNKRFITEVNEDNTTSLVFGNGLLNGAYSNDSFISEVFEDMNEINSFIQGILPNGVNPTVSYNTLGESPSHTTLTVTYRVGGGIKANVPAETCTTLLSKNTLQGNPDPSSLSSLTVTNKKPAIGGADKETIQEIKERSKINFSTQMRAVTKQDYEARVKTMPAKYGNIAKVYVRRSSTAALGSSYDVFDINTDTTIGGSVDATEFQNILGRYQAGNQTLGDGNKMDNIRQFILNFNTQNVMDNVTPESKNVEIYSLSYDSKKYLSTTPISMKTNILNYLDNYKLLTDDVEVKNGYVINFGIKFVVVARKSFNKSDVKLQCIQELKNYFNINNMDFNQTLYKSDIENLLYNVSGVKTVKSLYIGQRADILSLAGNLHAPGGIPSDAQGNDASSGTGSLGYGWAYPWEDFGNGVYPSAHTSTPSVFELKNPDDNIKGIVE